MHNLEDVRCVTCDYGPVQPADSGVVCINCGATYHRFRGMPVFLSAENSLFPPDAYDDSKTPSSGGQNLSKLLKPLVPTRSINLSRDRMFQRIAADYGTEELKILVIGCGRARTAIEAAFAQTKFSFCHTDIDVNSDGDVICDAHDLPFQSECFDGVITTAVMEHVLNPDVVASEIVRVLTPGGFVYSEVPFLQAVHEGAYDFTRFSLSGHRRLFERFDEKEAGMVAGPGTALVWQINECARFLVPTRPLSAVVRLVLRYLTFWIKYLDYLVAKHPRAVDAASGTYFYGTLRPTPVDAADIIRRY
ncbi:MAG: class I SAM-dependent methyltransferase, partial [Pseudomonadota bacterium]